MIIKKNLIPYKPRMMSHKDQGQPHSILNLGAHIFIIKFYYLYDLETFNVETETGTIECHKINNLLSLLGPYWGITKLLALGHGSTD